LIENSQPFGKKFQKTVGWDFLTHTVEYFEYFCQMSSKSIFTIVSYTVSKLVHFSETVY